MNQTNKIVFTTAILTWMVIFLAGFGLIHAGYAAAAFVIIPTTTILLVAAVALRLLWR